jgi:hypothetical protein
MVRSLGLVGVRVIQCRAEDLVRHPREAAAYDLALARAVAPLIEQGRLAGAFLRPGGLFLAQVGRGASTPGPPETPGGLIALGFEAALEVALPPELGLPGRRVLALRRIG